MPTPRPMCGSIRSAARSAPPLALPAPGLLVRAPQLVLAVLPGLAHMLLREVEATPLPHVELLLLCRQTLLPLLQLPAILHEAIDQPLHDLHLGPIAPQRPQVHPCPVGGVDGGASGRDDAMAFFIHTSVVIILN